MTIAGLDAVNATLALTAAFMAGFSKSGLPGSGILIVPLMAHAFGPRLSVGATLPLLIVGDICAVSIHRSHAQWPVIGKLIPSVVTGLLAGTVFLLMVGKPHVLNYTIGSMVLAMVILSLLRGKLGDKLVPTSTGGTAFTGGLAGFTTMTANAAGPIMAIYMTATKLPKHQLMSTSAWYFFILNLTKLPFLIAVTAIRPTVPLLSLETLTFNLVAIPVIVFGSFLGIKIFHKIPQGAFNNLILILAAIASVMLFIT